MSRYNQSFDTTFDSCWLSLDSPFKGFCCGRADRNQIDQVYIIENVIRKAISDVFLMADIPP
jgi:hypothetical protein